MISCGSFSFGKCECLPFSGREGKEVSFQILLLPALPPPPPLYRLPAAFPLGSLDPGHPKQVRSGASAPLGRGARGGGDREGKCNTQSAVSPVRPPKRNPRSCLACYSKGTHPPFLSPEVSASHMGKARPSGCRAGSAARRPVSALAPRGRCTSPGRCKRDAPALRGICPAAARSFRGEAGGLQLWRQPRVLAPTLRSAPKPCHLQTQTPDECLKITMLPGLALSLSYARRLAANGTQSHSPHRRPLAGGLAGGGLGASPAVSFGHRAGEGPALLTPAAL